MSKVDVNKQNKRNSLLTNAYDLFVNQGFNKTTISDIAKHSGLAKGTFYLYFKDKYDLRDELVARKSAQILLEAQKALKVRPVPINGLEDYLLAMVDYILNFLQRNRMLLKFISKNLSWGVFRHAVEKTSENPASNDLGEFYENYLLALKADNYECDDPELLLFTIIELVSSTGFSCIMYDSPCTMEEYLPHLHHTIHLILEGYRLPKKQNDSEHTTDAQAKREASEEAPKTAEAQNTLIQNAAAQNAESRDAKSAGTAHGNARSQDTDLQGAAHGNAQPQDADLPFKTAS